MILVLGGAGYIGSHTVKHLIENDYDCVIGDNLKMGHQEAILSEKFENIDLNDKKSLEKIFEKYDIDSVIHFANYAYVGESVKNPQKYYQNNLIGTLNLLNVMLDNNIKKIVFSSTCSIYGNPRYTPLDEKHPQNPLNPYGQSKLIIEKIMNDYYKAYGLKYIALRYFNASGADKEGLLGESHDPETHLIPLVLKAIKGEIDKVIIFGTDYNTPDGTCIRDYVHVEDLALAHRLALEKLDEFCGSINLGTGTGNSVKEIIKIAEKITNKSCPVIYGDRRQGDAPILIANNIMAKEVLGWKTKFDKIDDIIQSAWIWEKNKKF